MINAKLKDMNPMIFAGLHDNTKFDLTYRKSLTLPEEIIEGVCSFFNLTSTEIRSKCRKREIVVPRQIAIHIICTHTNLNLKAIGALFGGMHHATILYAKQTVEDLYSTSKRYKRQFDLCRNATLLGLPYVKKEAS